MRTKGVPVGPVRLIDVPVGEYFRYEDKLLELVNHDTSGSMSAGPRCRNVATREDVYLHYLKQDMRPVYVLILRSAQATPAPVLPPSYAVLSLAHEPGCRRGLALGTGLLGIHGEDDECTCTRTTPIPGAPCKRCFGTCKVMDVEDCGCAYYRPCPDCRQL